MMEGAAAAAAASHRPRRSAAEWVAQCRAAFDALGALAVVFAVRGAALYLHAVAETVQQQTAGKRTFDHATLKAITAVHPSLVSWVEEPGPTGRGEAAGGEMDEWAAAEAAWEAACAALDNDGGKRVRIVVAFEPNAVRLGFSPISPCTGQVPGNGHRCKQDTGGVKGNATGGAVRSRKRSRRSEPADAAARWMGGGPNGLSALLQQARDDFGRRCEAYAAATPPSELPCLSAAEEVADASQAAKAGGAARDRWQTVTPANFLEYVQDVGLHGSEYAGQLVGQPRVLPARVRKTGAWPRQLSETVRRQAQAVCGELYSHQSAALESILNGVDTVVVRAMMMMMMNDGLVLARLQSC